MSAIESIKATLGKHPNLCYEESADSISVLSQDGDGFPVSLAMNGDVFVVSFAGWHEEFDTEAEALDCVAFGLSESCRLLVASRGSFDYRWTVEGHVDGRWKSMSTTGRRLAPFWRPFCERVLQNHVTPRHALALGTKLRMSDALHGWLLEGGWQVTGIRLAEEFFRALPQLVPLPVYLCLEGTPARDVRDLLQAHKVAAGLPIQRGTIWPKETLFHVLATEAFLLQLADLAAHKAAPEICMHLHAYDSETILLQWYDAFDDPLRVDASVPEAAVSSFCGSLQVEYARSD